MWSSLTVLPPVDMSIVVVVLDGAGRGRGEVGVCSEGGVVGEYFGEVCGLEELGAGGWWVGEDIARICGWRIEGARKCMRLVRRFMGFT